MKNLLRLKGKVRLISMVWTGILLWGLILWFEFPAYPLQKTVDRIVAVVDNQVITLADLKIVKEFHLYQTKPGDETLKETKILIRLINQELVKQVARENGNLDEEKIQENLERLKDRLGEKVFQRKLLKWGLQPENLKEYIREKIVYKNIIERKFKDTVVITLQDIKDYYREEYLPSQQKKGKEPSPLTEVLEEIELRVKKKKVEQQAEDWLRNLRKEAKIHIKMDEYKNIWNESE
ncbi:hypothetical protein KGY73_03150 [bacterium]|nr:hypothetical protein [bacterium]